MRLDYKIHIEQFAVGAVSLFGYKLDVIAKNSLTELLWRGFPPMEILQKNVEVLKNFQIKVIEFVSAFASKADEIGPPEREIGIVEFNRIKQWLCPFPPFIKGPC